MFISYFKYCLSTLFILMLSLSAQAEVYKWIDSAGQTHYSQVPPEDYDIEKLKADLEAKAIPKQLPQTVEQINKQTTTERINQQQAVDQLIQQQAADRAERQQQALAKQQAQMKTAAKAKNCEIAKFNLIQYQANPAGRKLNANGEAVRVDQEQHQQRTNQLKQEIQTYC